MIIFLVKFLNITQNLVTQRVLFQLDVLSDMSTEKWRQITPRYHRDDWRGFTHLLFFLKINKQDQFVFLTSIYGNSFIYLGIGQ